MKAYFDPRQLGHAPETYFRGGAPMPHPEQPARATLLREMLEDNGFPVLAPDDYGEAPIKAVHDPDYVDFFKDAYARFEAEAPEGAMCVPTRHPGRRRGRVPRDIHGAMGWWMTDTSTPLTPELYASAYWSAQSAVAASEDLMGGASATYALCRPPGHHAMAADANGFCIFNNACIAAHRLRGRWGKIGLLDVDVHTGNGSLDILYERGDIFLCSLHANPAVYPTFYLGHAEETGAGDGAGTVRNEVLELGASQDTVLEALNRGIAAIAGFGAEALVVSLGFDMAHDDPLAAVQVHADGFAEMARRIAAMGLPTVLVQEGGYLGPSLKANAEAFLTAYREVVES